VCDIIHPLQCTLCDVHCSITQKNLKLTLGKGTYYAIYKSHKLVNYLQFLCTICNKFVVSVHHLTHLSWAIGQLRGKKKVLFSKKDPLLI